MKDSQTHTVAYDPASFNNYLDLNFDIFNANSRYPNRKQKIANQKVVFEKNHQSLTPHFFIPSELLAKTVFNINEDHSQAIITKDLNSLMGLNDHNLDDVVL